MWPGIPYRQCGKLIVAVDDSELKALSDLHERAKLNNVPGLIEVDQHQIKEIEPYCKVNNVPLKPSDYPVINLVS